MHVRMHVGTYACVWRGAWESCVSEKGEMRWLTQEGRLPTPNPVRGPRPPGRLLGQPGRPDPKRLRFRRLPFGRCAGGFGRLRGPALSPRLLACGSGALLAGAARPFSRAFSARFAARRVTWLRGSGADGPAFSSRIQTASALGRSRCWAVASDACAL